MDLPATAGPTAGLPHAGTSGGSQHFLLATVGSFGDLHPYVAIGRGLRARGHRVTLAASGNYREKIEGEGLEFVPIPPDLPEGAAGVETIRRAMDAAGGTEYVVRQMIMPTLRAQYDALLPVAREADVLVSHALTY